MHDRGRACVLIPKGAAWLSPRIRRRVMRAEDETEAAYWTLDALAEAAREMGIRVGRSQVRRILLSEGVRWRNTRPWAHSSDPEFVPPHRGVVAYLPTRGLRRTVLCG